jgi:serine/threonine protein kinase/Tfp pilus assembly protein PilF
MRCPHCDFENPAASPACLRCAAPLTLFEQATVDKTRTLLEPPTGFGRGKTFAGRYEIIEALGQGGMGILYRVFDQKTQEDVAIKILNPEIAFSAGTIERFRNELKLARKISHKNVCRVYDLAEWAGTYYITMEYVPGENLKNMIKMTGLLSLDTATNIAMQICEGLAEAHWLGVIHRDLKPSNIMIDRDGIARIMDFGIARSLDKKGTTAAGLMVGTPEYMSPEQAEGLEADQRSDIYALGVILYEMVTGELPFGGTTPLSYAIKHKTERPQDPRQINAQIPEVLSRLILRCLEKDQEKRPQSAEALLSELKAVESVIPAAEKAIPRKKPAKEKTVVIRRKTLISTLVVAAAIVVILILAGRSFFRGGRQTIDSIAVLPFENVNADFDTEYLADGITESIIGKLTQLPSLKKVIARSSVLRYKGKSLDPQAAGRELGVDAILASRLNRRGDELYISVELMRVRDNSHLWGNRYRLRISEIFSVEEQITSSITDNLRLRLSGEQMKRLTKRYTENSQAFIAYSKGSYFWSRRTEEDLKTAISYFRQAIQLDPNYALPYTGLSYSYLLLPEYGHYSPVEGYPLAKDAALKSIAIDSALSEAHVCLAQLKWRYDRDWRGSEGEYKLAIDLDPGNATAHHWYGYDLMCFGRYEEAIREIKRALELDPRSLVINRNLGQVYFRAGRFAEAKYALQKTLEMDPKFSFAHQYLGCILYQEGKYQEALAEFLKEKEFAKGWDSRIDSWLGVTYLKLGQRNKTQEILADLEKKSGQMYVPPTTLAALYFVLGDTDKGFKCLDRAYEVYDSFLRLIGVDALFDSIRSDPRYLQNIKKINLEN